ncbi:MAG: hypothetical protein MZV65_43510 [Chromatiales bacterium]|nr:hypothetical protein [Chromatiales bacterium]
MKSWYSVSELAGLPGLPSTDRAIQIRAKREGWAHRPRQGRGGGKEYAFDCLPLETREFLARQSLAAIKKPNTDGRIVRRAGVAPSGAGSSSLVNPCCARRARP